MSSLDGCPTAALPAHRWEAAEAIHRERVDRLLAAHLERARRGQRHPVEDFLFRYYSLRPGQLRRWHPGPDVALLGPAARVRLSWPGYAPLAVPGGEIGVGLDVPAFLARRGSALRRIRNLLAATAARPSHLGCFGLHEWAMVYRQPEQQRRHTGWPLRLGATGTDAVLDAQQPRCTHFDAFRFFTPQARPLNASQPVPGDREAFEQPGCLHATMDLYKWSSRLLPAVPSELVADCFVLARDARELDMRASPYDLRELGYDPVPVETAEGRAAYVEAQRDLAARGAVLRERIIAAGDALLASGGRSAAGETVPVGDCRPTDRALG